MKTTTLATRGEPDKEAHFGVRGELVIEARDIGKRFGRTIALDGLNMSVPRGSVYALLGRNGADLPASSFRTDNWSPRQWSIANETVAEVGDVERHSGGQ